VFLVSWVLAFYEEFAGQPVVKHGLPARRRKHGVTANKGDDGGVVEEDTLSETTQRGSGTKHFHGSPPTTIRCVTEQSGQNCATRLEIIGEKLVD
jgi:hypothetical protein